MAGLFGEAADRVASKREKNSELRTWAGNLIFEAEKYAADQDIEDGKEFPVLDLAGYNPVQAAVAINALIDQNPGNHTVYARTANMDRDGNVVTLEVERKKRGEDGVTETVTIPGLLYIVVGQRVKRVRKPKEAEAAVA